MPPHAGPGAGSLPLGIWDQAQVSDAWLRPDESGDLRRAAEPKAPPPHPLLAPPSLECRFWVGQNVWILAICDEKPFPEGFLCHLCY